VQAQAAAYRRGRLGAARTAALEALGFPWATEVPMWARYVNELAAFKATHGHLRVPQETKLGAWLCAQRSSARRGRLGGQRIAALDRIDYQWAGEPAGWDARAARWEAYVARTGDVEVRQAGIQAAVAAKEAATAAAASAAAAATAARPRSRRGAVPASVTAASGAPLVAAAAADVASRPTVRAQADAAAAAPAAAGGDAAPAMAVAAAAGGDARRATRTRASGRRRDDGGGPTSTIFAPSPLPFSLVGDPDPEAFDLPRLYNWVVSQRLHRRTGRLNAARVARLDASGFVWDVHETAWRSRLLLYVATRDAALRARAAALPGGGPSAASLPPLPTNSPVAGLDVLTPAVLSVDAGDVAQAALARLTPHQWTELLTPIPLPPVPIAPSPSLASPPLRLPLRASLLPTEAEAALLPATLPPPLSSVPLWVAAQRRRLAAGSMPRARLLILLAVGFPFEPLDVLWEAHADALVAAVGRPRVGERERVRASRVAAACGADARLFFWVRSQRAAAAGGALPTARTARLRELGALTGRAPGLRGRRDA